MSTHYSLAQKPHLLLEQADIWAKTIRKYCERQRHKKVPVFIYCGMSGVASVTALIMFLKINDPSFSFYMMYARKQGEHSHGERVEHSFDLAPAGSIKERERLVKNTFPVFVDDFICSGDTKRHALSVIGIKLRQIREEHWFEAPEWWLAGEHGDPTLYNRTMDLQFNYDPDRYDYWK
jgi:hypothetical protein